MYEALRIIVTGRIQGVGFRPFIYSLAVKHHLTGSVQNNRGRVTIVVEGEAAAIRKMVKELTASSPPLSKIDQVNTEQVPPAFYQQFTILRSEETSDSLPLVSPDAAVCEDCLEEFSDPTNRRYRYPFINCTQCGPRYTITKRLPYDRPYTTMGEFEMCPLCRSEYENPLDRRHHAQPICCPRCGPAIKLFDLKGKVISEDHEAIKGAVNQISQGKIAAVKGIGGYHLVCDAFQTSAIKRLRQKKNRPQRPLAIMVKSLDDAKKYCEINKLEEEMLTRPARPIVVLKKKADCPLPESISPGLSTIGIMLPYTPLHYLLFEKNVECLVMTSANLSGRPISYRERPSEELASMCWIIIETSTFPSMIQSFSLTAAA
ncbi:Sua5/YciO/YrdC/YwlC family protein [Halobacillus sp. Marseille-Q1614]|uniref:Sua5/YciO/YrdC/YwlC family protein n=1 Tax=Halobacillus sp. Marseille-Q1614 TaxID=2709134 RepID=UPI0020C2397F|nr:Sua5/YciO/YrdC/YwlC family protein [Halobacillus sp. Marseille-Q1614]